MYFSIAVDLKYPSPVRFDSPSFPHGMSRQNTTRVLRVSRMRSFIRATALLESRFIYEVLLGYGWLSYRSPKVTAISDNYNINQLTCMFIVAIQIIIEFTSDWSKKHLANLLAVVLTRP